MPGDPDPGFRMLEKLPVIDKGMYTIIIQHNEGPFFMMHFYLSLVSAPTNWSKGKFLGSGAFGQVCVIKNFMCTSC